MNPTINNNSVSIINEVPTIEILSNTPKDAYKVLLWQGRDVFALHIPEAIITPNLHPELLGENNDNYDTSLQVYNNPTAVVEKTSNNSISINGTPFTSCSGNNVRISAKYCIDFDTDTLISRITNFQHPLKEKEKVSILEVKSTFTENNVDNPPSYSSLFPNKYIA